MSRQRQSTVVWWIDSDGDRQEQRLVFTDDQDPLSQSAPPRSSWLVEALDPAKHRVAVLVANAGHPPLVYAARSGSPTFVLLPEGLAAAHVVHDDQNGAPVVAPVGAPRPCFPVWCPLCRTEWPLDAARLHSRRGPKPGRPGRFTVGATHTV